MTAKELEFKLMRRITSPALLKFLTKRKVRKLGMANFNTGASQLMDADKWQHHAAQLSKEGYSVLDKKLDEAAIEKIIAYSKTIKCHDPYNDHLGEIDPNSAPEPTHLAHFNRKDLVDFKPIMDLANDPGVLAAAQAFLGGKPTISNVNMWWSFGGRKQAEHAQLFHRDFDDWKFCKLFIYLTDVSATSGPHVYVSATSQSSAFRKIRRYSDAEIEKQFGKDSIKTFVAPKGTAFLVDTYGFHKGLLPEKGNRLLFQVQYSTGPIGIENYEPVEVLHAGDYDAYINRLLIKK